MILHPSPHQDSADKFNINQLLFKQSRTAQGTQWVLTNWQSPHATTRLSQSTFWDKNTEWYQLQSLRTSNLVLFAYFVHRNQQPWERVPIKWKVKSGGKAVHSYWHFELYIELARIFGCQDDVLTKNYVADYLQACDTVMLVVRAAGKHEESHAETKIMLIKKHSSIQLVLYRRWQWQICHTKRWWLPKHDREHLGE